MFKLFRKSRIRFDCKKGIQKIFDEGLPNPNAYFYNPETGLNEPFNWNDLFYFLSLNGLQESAPFSALYPLNPVVCYHQS